MYARVMTRKNKDGRERKYLYLVEGKREGSRVKQKNVCSFGRIDSKADHDRIRKMVKEIGKFVKGVEVSDGQSQEVSGESGKEYGTIYLYRQLWKQMGFSDLFEKHDLNGRSRYSIEEAILAMVINRLSDPGSKRALMNWKEGVCSPEWEKITLQGMYRAMDKVLGKKTEIEKEIFNLAVRYQDEPLDVVMFDTTSIMHWGEGEHGDLLTHGYSKEKRGDLKQIMVGVLMSRSGIPVAHEVWEGSQNDLTSFPKVIKELKTKYQVNRIILVCDKGMISATNIYYLEQAGYEYIVGARLKTLSKERQGLLLGQEGFKAVIRQPGKSLDVKDVALEDTRKVSVLDEDGKRVKIDYTFKSRYVVCLNHEVAKNDAKKRERFRYILEKKVPYSSVKSFIKQNGFKKYVRVKGDNIRLEVDFEALEKEAIYDGKWAVVTNTKLPSKDIVQAYKDLSKIEQGFRDLKSCIEIDPMYHWTNHRIRTHVFICFLSLILKLSLKKRIKAHSPDASVSDVLNAVDSIKALSIRLDGSLIHLRSSVPDLAQIAFHSIGVTTPNQRISYPSLS